jgi:hypothetical protein
MKNLIFFLIIISNINAFAQNKLKSDAFSKDTLNFEQDFCKHFASIGRVSLGIKAGFIQSNLYGSDVNFLSVNNQTSPLNGFHFGITANSMIGKYFWLKHELNFQQNGAGITLSDSINGDYKSGLKMYSLQLLPISPTFRFKGFQIYAGPYISALLDASIKRKDDLGNTYTDKSIFGNGTENTEFNKYLQKFDFGIATGIEYEFNFGLNIGLRYTRGFIPIFDNANVNTFGQDKPEIKIYNHTMSIGLGYSFRKKQK